jgi:hypothetical protein
MADDAYTAWLTELDLRTLIEALATRMAQMILEAVDEVAFLEYRGEIDLRHFEAGRIFGPTCEIRWQRDGERFHTLLLGDVAEFGERIGTHHVELSGNLFDDQEKAYYLWGEWRDDSPQWVEASVPHIFNYPQPRGAGAYRRKVTAIEYINRESGELEFYRFTGTQEEKL